MVIRGVNCETEEPESFCNTNSCNEISFNPNPNPDNKYCLQKYGCSTSSVDQCHISANCGAKLFRALFYEMPALSSLNPGDPLPVMSDVIDDSFGEECAGLKNNNIVRAALNTLFQEYPDEHLPELQDPCCETNEAVFITMMNLFGFPKATKCNNLSPEQCDVLNSLKCSDGSLPKCYSESIWSTSEGKYCDNADFVIDDNQENPDATTLGACKTLCEEKEDCTAITYYGETATDDWKNKCYLSRGVCTQVDSNVNGAVYSFDRCPDETPLKQIFPPSCADGKKLKCPNDNCKTLDPMNGFGLLIAPCCDTCQNAQRTWADLGEQVNPADSNSTNSYVIGCTQLGNCKEDIGDLSVCQQECDEFWDGEYMCNAINYKDTNSQCCMKYCEDTSNPTLNFTYQDDNMGLVDANIERLKWQKWVRNDVFPEEIEECPLNQYWQKEGPDSIFKVSDCAQCPEGSTQLPGQCTECIGCCNKMPLKNPDGSCCLYNMY